MFKCKRQLSRLKALERDISSIFRGFTESKRIEKKGTHLLGVTTIKLLKIVSAV